MKRAASKLHALPAHALLEASPRLTVDCAPKRQGDRKWCGKAPGFGKDSVDPPNTGKGFPHPLPALSMTRAQAAHDHFRIQGQLRKGPSQDTWPGHSDHSNSPTEIAS